MLHPSVRITTVLFLTAALVAGCRDEDVVARVGRTELRRADVEAFASQRAPDSGDTQAQLEALIDRARLAEQAEAQGLDDRPGLRARLAAARREVLAQALLEEQLKDATQEQALRARFASSKEALSRRELHVRHIMLRLPQGADEAEKRRARDRANLLYAHLLGGASFEQVARESSQDEATAPRGGDLGRILEGQIHPSFFEAAAALKKDEVSKPFETPYGLHIVQALAPVETRVPSFEEARGRLAAQSRREAEDRLMKDLRERVSVERFQQALRPLEATPPDAGSRVGEESR
ncbi:hypothetical protein G4177_36335 [Corallococcus sp. ZKHCc1 1396]|uniref:PpiC domain-containing protein n=1 Tax=Corallococcus soli TaxID=2710757 RepID=A0ABR9Q0G1_9BACT|nr:hypothetical protein [Corallococcus soli]